MERIMKNIFIILSLVLGVFLLGTSKYIDNQLDQGKSKLEKAEKGLDTTSKLSSISPFTKALDKGLTQGANKKIGIAKDEIAKYQNISKMLKIGSIFFFTIGGFLIFHKLFSRKK